MLVLIAVSSVLALMFISWRRRVGTASLGSVRAGWIAAHRATESHYAER
jgi:hypothetical protein